VSEVGIVEVSENEKGTNRSRCLVWQAHVERLELYDDPVLLDDERVAPVTTAAKPERASFPRRFFAVLANLSQV
jgi:hypothetical protein